MKEDTSTERETATLRGERSVPEHFLEQFKQRIGFDSHIAGSRRVWMMATVGAIATLSLASSYLRDLTLTSAFSLSRTLDIYLLALAVPQLIGIEAGNLAVTVLLPRYAADAALGTTGVGHHLRRDYAVWGLGFVGLTVVIAASSGVLAGLLAAGLTESEKASVAAWLVVLSPLVAFLGLAGVGRAWLDAHGKVWVGAIRSVPTDARRGVSPGRRCFCAWSVWRTMCRSSPPTSSASR